MGLCPTREIMRHPVQPPVRQRLSCKYHCGAHLSRTRMQSYPHRETTMALSRVVFKPLTILSVSIHNGDMIFQIVFPICQNGECNLTPIGRPVWMLLSSRGPSVSLIWFVAIGIHHIDLIDSPRFRRWKRTQSSSRQETNPHPCRLPDGLTSFLGYLHRRPLHRFQSCQMPGLKKQYVTSVRRVLL